MRPFRLLPLVALALIVSVGLSGGLQARAAAVGAHISPLALTRPPLTRPRSLLYVANYLSNTITEYALPVSRSSAPIRTIGGPRTGLHHAFGIALDRLGRLYVVNSEFPASITIFAPHARGDATPVCTIAGNKTGLAQPLWIAIDDSGALFVTDAGIPAGEEHGEVHVFAAGACGNVAPSQVIAGPQTLLRSPGGIAFNASGDIVVASSDGVHPPTSAGLVFPHNANGNVRPSLFGGTDSGLALPFGIASIPIAGGFWVANPANSSVVAYARSSGSDLDPVRVIAGPRTGMRDYSVTGVALDEQRSLYVSNRFSTPTLDTILIFDCQANGNATPAASIGGPQARLFGPGGLAVGPE